MVGIRCYKEQGKADQLLFYLEYLEQVLMLFGYQKLEQVLPQQLLVEELGL